LVEEALFARRRFAREEGKEGRLGREWATNVVTRSIGSKAQWLADECQKYLDRCGRVQMMNGADMAAWCSEICSGDVSGGWQMRQEISHSAGRREEEEGGGGGRKRRGRSVICGQGGVL